MTQTRYLATCPAGFQDVAAASLRIDLGEDPNIVHSEDGFLVFGSRAAPGRVSAWNSQFRRFRRWASGGVFQKLFESLSGDPDPEYVLIDGTIVPVHQKAAGAKGALSASRLAAPAAG